MAETMTPPEAPQTTPSGNGNKDIPLKTVVGEKPSGEMVARISPSGETTYNNEALAKLQARIDKGDSADSVLKDIANNPNNNKNTEVKKRTWPKKITSVLLLAGKLLGRGGGDAITPHDFMKDIAHPTQPGTVISGEMPSQQISFEPTSVQTEPTAESEPQGENTTDQSPTPDISATPNETPTPDITPSKEPTPQAEETPQEPKNEEPSDEGKPSELRDLTKGETPPTPASPPVSEHKPPTAMPGTGGGGMAGRSDPNQEAKDPASQNK